jgi:hypothetical protein
MPRRGTVAISWWMLSDRLIAPRSKLGPVDAETATASLGAVLGLGQMKDLKAYEALDWLFERQARIENGLARRHLEHGVLVLYDVSSSYFESRHYPLAHYGHSRDHRVDRLQTFTACRARGTACLCGRSVRGQYGGSDDAEIADREAEIALRYQADGAGRRPGMITTAWIGEDLKSSGLDWITCLRAPQIQALAQDHGPLQLSLFDDGIWRRSALLTVNRPICTPNDTPDLRARKREAPLVATERELARIQAQVRKGSQLRAAVEIDLSFGAVVNAKKMAKHFTVDISEGHFTFTRKVGQIAAEAKLDAPAAELSTAHAVQRYKELSRVERAFRSMKTVDLEIRPIRHWSAKHLTRALAPLLFRDTDLEAARAERSSSFASTESSPAAKSKKGNHAQCQWRSRNSFAGVIDHPGTMTRNTMGMPLAEIHPFTLLSKSSPLQEATSKLLGFDQKSVQ